MKEIFEAVTERIKAPYFGYAVLAFIALNWRGIFLLALTPGSPQVRLDAFDSHTDQFTLVVYPLAVGALVTLFTPWIRYGFGWAARIPSSLTEELRISAEHSSTLLKAKLERSRNELLAEKEVDLIERAKRDAEVNSINDPEIQKKLMDQLEAVRQERDKLNEQLIRQNDPTNFDERELKILGRASKHHSGLISVEHSDKGPYLKVNGLILGYGDRREFALYQEAIESLVEKGILQDMGGLGQTFVLTNAGWIVSKPETDS